MLKVNCMAQIVRVEYPVNIDEKNKYLYQDHITYVYKSVKVKTIKNVFVTFSGFCLNNKGLIKESHHNYPEQYHLYLKEALKYLQECLKHTDNLITLNDSNIYLCIHHPWFNYFHWITESIFRLWLARKQLNRTTLILPEYYKNYDFITGSLEPFKIENIYYIPNGKSLMVKNLCLPQIKTVCDSYSAIQLKRVSNFYRNFVLTGRDISANKKEKLYVSRKFARSRQVINEEEIIVILEKYGFFVFYPEHYTFMEQVAVFSCIKFLIGTHGSGLTNLLFMEKNTSVFELHKNKTNELDYPSPLFWYMANALKINYYHQVCTTAGKEDYYQGDYVVEPKLFEQNIIKMIGDR
jgi:Glycosyltransferase 61